LNEKTDGINKNKKQQNIRIIDVSGERKFRQKSWSQYYDQIHGLIFVIDASEKRRLNENQETLEELLGNEKLKNKPILM
jgi:GTPase SAR1 family protein